MIREYIKMKKYIFITSITLYFFCFITNINALEIRSQNAILYNINDNICLIEKEVNEKIPVASLTKIMTVYTAIQLIDQPDERIVLQNKVFKGLIEANASVAGFYPGQKVSFRDLLYGTFLPSGADGAQALAYSLAGSVEAFVALMNENAQKIGMNDTHFMNTTGFDEENHYSTVSDIALLLQTALKDNFFYEIFTTKRYTTSDKKLIFYSTLSSTLQRYDLNAPEIIGAKTGYTYQAGRCLASVAYDEKNDIYYMLVTARSFDKNNNGHIKDALTIYPFYFENYGYHTLIEEKQELITLPVRYGNLSEITFHSPSMVKLYGPNNLDISNIILQYEGTNEISYSLEKGTKLGEIHVYSNEQYIDSIDIILEEELSFSLFSFLKTNIIYIIVLTSILFASYITLKKKLKREL